MRRTSAQMAFDMPGRAPVVLADTRCVVCGALADAEGAVYAFGSCPDRGAIERAYCSIDHAKTEGWPWITPRSERRP